MTALARRFFACLLAGLSLASLAEDLPPLAHSVAGGDTVYTIQPDFLIAIGARFGVAPELLAKQNAIRYEAIIRPGQRLRIDNPHIVPAMIDDGVLINIPQRMLFRFSQGKLTAAYPVGLGKPSWPTPGRIQARLAGKEQALAGSKIHPGRNAPGRESRAGKKCPPDPTIPWAPISSD